VRSINLEVLAANARFFGSCPLLSSNGRKLVFRSISVTPGDGDPASPAGHHILDRGGVASCLTPITLWMAGFL
jgi:hypothetical protein